MKEVHFKTLDEIYEIYPCKDFLQIRYTFQDNVCKFCQIDIESQRTFIL